MENTQCDGGCPRGWPSLYLLTQEGSRKGKKEASLVVDNRVCISEIGIGKGKSCDLPYIFCTLCVSAGL